MNLRTARLLQQLGHYDGTQTFYDLSHVGVTCDDVNVCSTGNITKHVSYLRCTEAYSRIDSDTRNMLEVVANVRIPEAFKIVEEGEERYDMCKAFEDMR